MTDIFIKMAEEAALEAREITMEIGVLCRIIAEKMERLHGEPQRIQIDHEVGFVVVATRLRRRRD